MKTPEEIKKGMECCPGQYSGVSCGNCPYSNDGVYCGENGVQIMKDALAYIQQLESENSKIDELTKTVREVTASAKEIINNRIKALEEDVAAAKRGRDALAKDLKAACKLLWSDDSDRCCEFCEHENKSKETGYCDKCANGNHFKFKPAALCPNMEVQEDG